VLTPAAIMLVAWQTFPLVPAPGGDSSWGAGLAMAIHDGLTFGSQVVFTYGPLGFLDVSPLWFDHLGLLAFVYIVLMRFGLATALYAGARQNFGPVGAFLLAAVVASVDGELPEMVIVLILSVWIATRVTDRRRLLLFTLAIGAFAGFESLTKVSYGLAIAVMEAALVLSLPGRRRDYVAAAAAGFVVTFLVFWLVLGQAISALPAYVENSGQIVSGYAAAMSSGVAPGFYWQFTAAFLLLGLGLWAAWHTTADGRPRQRLGVALLWAVFWFFAFKESFVRWDSPHATALFVAALGGFLAFRWRRDHRWAALVGTATMLTLALAVQGQSLTGDIDPSRNVSDAIAEFKADLNPTTQAALTAAGRAEIQSAEPIDPASLNLLRGHTVTIFPQEIALAWAYGLDWRPIPVLQSYSAYTAGLDRLDAQFLASKRAPDRILLQPPTDVDLRVPSFDQPMAIRTLLCRYHLLRKTPALAILARGVNRCSAVTPLVTYEVDWKQAVPVPAPPNPHSLVFVRIGGVGIGGVERLKALLWEPAMRYVMLNGGAPNRLVGATAADGLPLRAAPGVDFPAPFSIAPDVKFIAVAKSGQGRTGGRAITYRFYAESFNSP
jgi:hypothetical protein